MVSIKTFLAAVVMLWPAVMFGQAGLPPQVQADILKGRVVDAVRESRHADAIALLADYRKLETTGSVVMPPVLNFLDARLSAGQGDQVRSYNALIRYFSKAQSDDENYREAVALASTLSTDPAVAAMLREKEEAEQQSILNEKSAANAAASQQRLRTLQAECKRLEAIEAEANSRMQATKSFFRGGGFRDEEYNAWEDAMRKSNECRQRLYREEG